MVNCIDFFFLNSTGSVLVPYTHFYPLPQKAINWTFSKKFLFISLTASGLGCGMQTFSCSLTYLFPQPGIKIGTPALGWWSLSHWTSREVPVNWIFRNITSSFTMFTFYVLAGKAKDFLHGTEDVLGNSALKMEFS